jgi:hypothetical protein
MGIFQFSVLLLFLMIYAVIVGSMVVRLFGRGAGLLSDERNQSGEEVPLGG